MRKDRLLAIDVEVSEEKWYDEAVKSRAVWGSLRCDSLERWREG